MEVSPAYKQTEVGVIPQSWIVAELQQVCGEAITYGIVQCGPHIENGVPYIRVSDMNARELDVTTMLRTSPGIAAKFARSTVKEADVVYALRGKLGEVRQVAKAVAGANLTQGTARLSPKTTIDSVYLLWAMRSPRSLRQAELEAKGTTFREITLADLRRIKVPLPSPAEQKAIAEALSDAEAAIASLEQLLAKRRQLKQGAVQELLTGKTRLPGFFGEWVTERLRDLVLPMQKTARPSAAGRTEGPYPFFTNSTKRLGKFLNEYDFNTEAIIANTGGEAFFNYYNGPFAAMADCLVFEARCATTFLYYHLKSLEPFIDHNGFTGSGIKHLDKKFFADIELHIPREEAEQTAIATILADLDAEIAELEAKLSKAHQIRQAMMQQLLTGRIRLV